MNEKIQKLKQEHYQDFIIGIMNANNGYITSKQITDLGIHRMYLNQLASKNIIDRVANGIYMDSSKLEDTYYVFSISTPNAIFSHMTALYFHGLSIKAPDEKWDITIKRDYHNSRVSKHEVFYVKQDIFNLGVTKVKTTMGNYVKAYDIERCICDIIKSKNRMDSEHIKYSIREYIKRKDKDLVKLSIYAEKMGIKKEVMKYLEIFYE